MCGKLESATLTQITQKMETGEKTDRLLAELQKTEEKRQMPSSEKNRILSELEAVALNRVLVERTGAQGF